MDTIRWFQSRVDSIMLGLWHQGGGMFTDEVVSILKIIKRLESRYATP